MPHCVYSWCFFIAQATRPTKNRLAIRQMELAERQCRPLYSIRTTRRARETGRCKPALCSNFAMVFSHSNNKNIAVAKKADRTAYDVRYGCGLVTLHRATLTRRQFTARQLIAATDSRVPFHLATLHRRPRLQHPN